MAFWHNGGSAHILFVQGFQWISRVSCGAFLVCSQIFSDTNDPTPMLYLFAQWALISQEAARPQSPKFMPEDFSAFEWWIMWRFIYDDLWISKMLICILTCHEMWHRFLMFCILYIHVYPKQIALPKKTGVGRRRTQFFHVPRPSLFQYTLLPEVQPWEPNDHI